MVEFVPADSAEADAISRVLLKETEKQKYKPSRVAVIMRNEGFPGFSVRDHTLLWQSLEAKDPNKPYGITLSDGQWYWYETWVDRVREHCRENAARFQ
ncbi:MAG: hypothetical protein H8E94_09580 [Alphaproteobacteria bacterium]|nr:hypothetical protein [Alphaproteobacteria bacterium]